MQAASPAHIEAFLAGLGAGVSSGVFGAAPTTALVSSRLYGLDISLAQLHGLSHDFLVERRQHMAGVLGPDAYSTPGVDFVFFPIAESCASTFIDRDQTTVFLSLGLVEALRLAVASAQLTSAIARLEVDDAVRDALGAAGLTQAVERLRLMVQYFNASAVLHFKAPGRLPAAADLLDPVTKHRVGVLLEAVLMFLLLHELGHVDSHRRAGADAATPHLVWEFAVPENVDAAKDEEFYADAFALKAVPPAFALPLVHAATFFLHLHNYVDATSGAPPQLHPLCVSRIARLYELARNDADADAVGHAAVAAALEAGVKAWTMPSGHFSLETLARYADALSKVDWRPAQEALQALTDQQPGYGKEAHHAGA